MFQPFALLTALALTVDPAAPTAEMPDRISYGGIGNGWTGGRTDWWIDRSGRGHYDSTERGRRVSGRFDAGTEGFERLRRILQPLEEIHEMPCDGGSVTDQPVGGLIWQRGRGTASLRLDFGCARNSDAEAWARFGEARALIVQWAVQ